MKQLTNVRARAYTYARIDTFLKRGKKREIFLKHVYALKGTLIVI